MRAVVTDGAATLLGAWLEARLEPAERKWLEDRLAKLERANSDRELHLTLGMIPRKLGRAALAPSTDELADAARVRDGWDPSAWTTETAARALVLCRIAERYPEGFGELFRDLHRHADLSESVTLLRTVPLLPRDSALDVQIGEGLRSNMRAVFEAIAHRNPYPREHFDENRWNHMVLKALFIESSLAPIQGLDARANAELAAILLDYADERRAAGRDITPELWRCVGPFADGAALDKLERVADAGSPREHDAALLALHASPANAAATVIGRFPDTMTRITDGTLTWDSVAGSPSPSQAGSGA